MTAIERERLLRSAKGHIEALDNWITRLQSELSFVRQKKLQAERHAKRMANIARL